MKHIIELSPELMNLLDYMYPKMHDSGQELFKYSLEKAIRSTVEAVFREGELETFHVESMIKIEIEK